MTIYVDDIFTAVPRTAQGRRYGNQWCHMITDGDLSELHAMAEKIGLNRQWFERCAVPHYDLVPSKRDAAIKAGAIAATNEQLMPIRKSWRLRWHGGNPDWEAMQNAV